MKKTWTLTETSPGELLTEAMKSAQDYIESHLRSSKVKRARRLKAQFMICAGNTPDGVPVMYIHQFMKNGIITRAFVVIHGKDGDGYVGQWEEGLYVIHGHAVNRYIERSGCTWSRENVALDIIDKTILVGVAKDSDTTYINYRDGVFLCHYDGKVLHLRTYITHKQCKANQRLWAKKAEMETEKFKQQLGIK